MVAVQVQPDTRQNVRIIGTSRQALVDAVAPFDLVSQAGNHSVRVAAAGTGDLLETTAEIAREAYRGVVRVSVFDAPGTQRVYITRHQVVDDKVRREELFNDALLDVPVELMAHYNRAITEAVFGAIAGKSALN